MTLYKTSFREGLHTYKRSKSISETKVEGSYLHRANKKVVRIEPTDLPYLTGKKVIDHDSVLDGNIERFLGYAQIPIGIAGPLLLNDDDQQTEVHVPLATTEGALVASYNRGMKALYLSGGVHVQCVSTGVQRSPYFKFETLQSAIAFKKWIEQVQHQFQDIVYTTSNHTVLLDLNFLQEGNSVILTFRYNTGAAAGQNMVTIATDAICNYIINNAPIKVKEWYIEGNYAGDKKATFNSLNAVRGKRVIGEATISRETVAHVLKSTPEAMCRYWNTSNLAMMQSGAIGNQGHVANALTAIFLACGQDVASVTESATGILRMELTDDHDLYVSLTLPSLVVGTVGGGTHLSTQRECLEILDCNGVEHAIKFARICCATALAGELSIAAAIAEGHFTSAHQSLGRKSK